MGHLLQNSFALLVAIPCVVVAADTPKGMSRFPNPECTSQPVMNDGAVACKYLGRPDGIPTYSLHFGHDGKLLLEFNRSAVVVQDVNPHRVAITSYEGSNYADCYVFWNAEASTSKSSSAHAWAQSPNLSSKAKALIKTSDHMYYTCTGWSDGRVLVEARWEQADSYWLVATAKLSSAGSLSDVAYSIVAAGQ
jgi:hypothetical protein